MTVGTTPKQTDLWGGTAAVCEGRVGQRSIWAVLHRECVPLFADVLFADLFADVGRRIVPPRIVAAVMVLQRLEGLSDREAVEGFSFDRGGSTRRAGWTSTTRGSATQCWSTPGRGWPPRRGRTRSLR